MLEIALLGPFLVKRDGITINQFEADTARALLAYLALQPGVPFPREVLADLLWPEAPRADALRALRQALNRLRSAIGDRETAPPLLHITHDTLAFSPTADYALDVAAFQAHITAAHTHPHRRLAACRSCMARLEAATALYRGDFLSGFFIASLSFEEWQLVQREMLHQQALEALYILAEYHARQGAYSEVCEYARRQLTLEPWREEAHQQLIHALALSGQRSAALAQYETCARTLAAELNIPPPPALNALRAHIATGESLPTLLPPYHVPEALVPCVGRETELTTLMNRLNAPEGRLLTLTGPGGIGKTRLALAVAAQARGLFRDGIFFAPLEALNTPDSLLPAIAQSLKFNFSNADELRAQLHNYLRARELLLVLDGFEHLIEGAEQLLLLLQTAPQLHLLITSRERLHLPGEEVIPIHGLDCNAHESPAAALFIQCARRLYAEFAPTPDEAAAIARIGALVQGVPLALELASAWVRDFSCAEIAQEIQRNLDFLAHHAQGLPERHRSLRAAFEHSWQLLDSPEQAYFQQLAVFHGGFDRAAAQAVSGLSATQLAALADKSLVQRTISAPASTRYLLHELVRAYATEKLARQPDVEAAARDRHAAHYLRLAQNPPQDPAPEWVDLEIQNLQAAWRWGINRGWFTAIAQATECLFAFYNQRGRFHEGEQCFSELTRALAEIPNATEYTLLGRAQGYQGWFTFRLGETATGKLLLQTALAPLRAADARTAFAPLLNLLGEIALKQGAYSEAQYYAQESRDLHHALADPFGENAALNVLARAAYHLSDYPAARAYAEAGLMLAQQLHQPQLGSDNLRCLGNIHLLAGAYADAETCYMQALTLYREAGNRWGESAVLNNLGAVAARRARHQEARQYFEQVLALKNEMGDRSGAANVRNNLGVLYIELGDLGRAHTLFEQALRLQQELGEPLRQAEIHKNLGNLYQRLGQYAIARQHLEKTLAIRRAIGEQHGVMRALGALGLLYHRTDQDALARDYLEAALNLARDLADRSMESYLLTCLGHVWAKAEQWDAAETAYQTSLALECELQRTYQIVETTASLAALYLARKATARALAQIEGILIHLTQDPVLTGADDPFNTYLHCYRVLQACADPRAADILALAHTQLQAWAEHIPSPTLRCSFRENVTAHKEILREYAAQSGIN